MRTVACMLLTAGLLAGCPGEPDLGPEPPIEAPVTPPIIPGELTLGDASEELIIDDELVDSAALSALSAGGRSTSQKKVAAARGGPAQTSSDPGLGIEGGRTISAAQVKKVVIHKMAQMRACYERELKKNPNTRGKVVLSWTIGADGRVRRPAVVRNTTRSRALTPCMTRAVKNWRFPRAQSPFDVEYPFTFKPKDW